MDGARSARRARAFSPVALLALAGVCALGLGLSLPTTALAQSASDQTIARDLFDRGIAAAGEERWSDALELFRDSRDRVPRASTTYNLGNVLVRLGRFLEARSELRAYLAQSASDPGERERRERAVTHLSDIERYLAHLELEVSPADAVVELDGAVVPGEGAQRTFELDPGRHVVTVRAPELEPVELVVSLLSSSVVRRQATLSTSRQARLLVRAPSSAAHVFLDGEEAGVGDQELAVLPGTHVVRVVDGGASVERSVDVTAEATLDLDLRGATDGGGIEREWWLWTLIGGLVIGAVVAIVVATTYDPGTEPGIPGDVGPGGIVMALSASFP